MGIKNWKARRPQVITGGCFIAVGIVILVARIVFVRWGILYGDSAVKQVDVIVGALIAIGTALLAMGWTRPRPEAKDSGAAGEHAGGGARWSDWMSGLTALVAAGTLVVSLMNLLEPVNPPRLAVPACPGARESNVPLVGITSGTDGDNSRQGPARSFPANGRFPTDCSVGFSAFCLGDPIPDSTGSTTDETWVTSRWLLVAKQQGGWRSAAARLLSGENPQPQFISDSFIFPETAYNALPLGSSAQCGASSIYPYPGKASLGSFDPKTSTFTARSQDAPNIGLAVWLPLREGFTGGNPYRQLVTTGAGPGKNPGETAADGSKVVEWSYSSLVMQVRGSRKTKGPGAGAVVVILAVPCLADNIPAKASTAAVAGYRISDVGPPVSSAAYPHGYDAGQLARAACEANT